MKVTPEQLKRDLAAVVDPIFAPQLVDNYINMQQRYYAGDWQPSELNGGGQFCEAVVRALYQVDTGIVDHYHLPNDMVNQLKSRTPPAPHRLDFKDRDHFCRVLQTTYKFRSDRGVAHVSATYTANHMDATVIMANVKWLFAEFLRLAKNLDRYEVAGIIEAIIQLEHPLIHELNGKPLVLSNSLTTPEEILVLLQHSLNGTYTRGELREFIDKDPSTINRAINRMKADKEVRIGDTEEVVITPLGRKRLHEEILPKLSAANGQRSR